nr:MAG TPA: hypothetical protein [Caudoviricetes sp.]
MYKIDVNINNLLIICAFQHNSIKHFIKSFLNSIKLIQRIPCLSRGKVLLCCPIRNFMLKCT